MMILIFFSLKCIGRYYHQLKSKTNLQNLEFFRQNYYKEPQNLYLHFAS